MKKKKLIVIIATVLIVALAAGGALMLKGKKGSEADKPVKPIDPPENYQVENVTIPALTPRKILVTQPLTPEQQAELDAQQAEESEQEETEKSFKEKLKEKKQERAAKKAEKKKLKEAKKAAKDARKQADQLEKQVEKLGENINASIEEQLKEAQALAEKKEAELAAISPQPKEEEEVPKEEGEEETIPTVSVIYRYDYLADLQQTVVNYIDQLTDEENGFAIVDETLLPLRRKPNFHVPAGMLLLARNSRGEEGTVDLVELAWQDETCQVTVTHGPGTVRELKPIQLLSSTEAVDYIKRMKPSMLQLDGDSMADYEVYALEGGVLVNNYPCIRLNIYRKTEGKTGNEIMGRYYLSADGEHLYLQNEDTGVVEELPRKEIPRTDILQEPEETPETAKEQQ